MNDSDDVRAFFVKAKPKSVRALKCTDRARFEAMEAVIEAAQRVFGLDQSWSELGQALAALDALSSRIEA